MNRREAEDSCFVSRKKKKEEKEKKIRVVIPNELNRREKRETYSFITFKIEEERRGA